MRRLSQVAEVIKQELAPLIQNELPVEFGLVTLTDVEVQDDLKQAKIYVSCFEGDFDKLLKVLEKNRSKFQKNLNRRLKMKYTPKIQFIPDKGFQNVCRVEDLLDKIQKRKA